MNKGCDFCGIRFDFKKSDIKERVFGKVGDKFNSTESKITKKSSFFLKRFYKDYHKITWKLDEEIKFKSVKCECCEEINWMTDFIPTFSNIESNGWYIKEYGKIKCHEVNRKTDSYECDWLEARIARINNVTENAWRKSK